MDFIRQLGPLVIDHRLRRLTESLLRAADEIYSARGLTFRARWASSYMILRDDGPSPIGEIAQRLRLTHPAIIGITNEMIGAGIAEASRDKDDGRRRIVSLTDKGRLMNSGLTAVWDAMAAVQANRFRAAGCDIIDVLNSVEDGMTAKSLSAEVIEQVAKARSRLSDRKSRTARRARAVARAILLVTAAGAMALAPREAASQTPAVIGQAERVALVRVLSDSLIGGYIYEKTGRTLADSLAAELRAGAYDGLTSGEAFATTLTETLRRITKDRHLSVRFGPPAGGGSMIRRVPASAAPAGAASSGPRRVLRRNDSVTTGSLDSTIPSLEYGIGKAEILPGNIGYLDIRGFSGNPAALRVVDSVMAIVANVDALIIDVGRNSGGGPQVIKHLSAYLFDKPTHLASSVMRGMGAPLERWTSPSVPGKRITAPVYILTSRRTFSAAESFTFGLRNNKRVTIVGEHTGGGGHFGDVIPLSGGFTMFLPRGRTYDPRTDKGWEAEGIKPDVEVSYDEALEKALELSRKR